MRKKGVDLSLIAASLIIIASIFAISSFKSAQTNTVTGLATGGGSGAECELCYPWICYNSVVCSSKCGPSQTCMPSPDICCGLCPAHDYTCVESNQTTNGNGGSIAGY